MQRGTYLDLAASAGFGGAVTAFLACLLMRAGMGVVNSTITGVIAGGLVGYLGYRFSEVLVALPQAIREARPRWIEKAWTFQTRSNAAYVWTVDQCVRPRLYFGALLSIPVILACGAVWLYVHPSSCSSFDVGMYLVCGLIIGLCCIPVSVAIVADALCKVALGRSAIYDKWHAKLSGAFQTWANEIPESPNEDKKTRVEMHYEGKSSAEVLTGFLSQLNTVFSWKQYLELNWDMFLAFVCVCLPAGGRKILGTTVRILIVIFCTIPVGCLDITKALFRRIHSTERSLSACYSMLGGAIGFLIAIHSGQSSWHTMLNAAAIGAVLSAGMACLAYRLITARIRCAQEQL